MSVADVIGPVESLTIQTVSFTCVKGLTGASGTVHYNLRTAGGLGAYVADYSSVSLVGGLSVAINAPTSSTVSYHAHICVIPEGFEHNGEASYPKGASQILTVPGSVSVQRSELVPSPFVFLGMHEEITGKLKPTTIIGSRPHIVCSWTSEGTDATSRAELLIRGKISVAGVGFKKTW
jgi:hypothetical protein